MSEDRKPPNALVDLVWALGIVAVMIVTIVWGR